ncbi:MAG: ectonucleotide pyrophosphatase/phosphodiesterase [Alistipes sp.]
MLRKISYIACILLAVACASTRKTVGALPPSTDNQYVIILSMDAFRWDLADRSHTPTLDSLKQAGSYAEIYPVYPSNTFPSHYSMATGLHPDHHGVVNNGFYDKTVGRKLSVFDREDVTLPNFWGGEPIWNTVERQGEIANIYMWPGSEVPINGRQASVWKYYSAKPTYYERADWVVEAMTRPVKEIPNLVMWYFEQPDADLHHFGPTSREAQGQAEHIDSVLRYFFYKIRQSPVYDKINFIITADHGMAALSPDRYLNLYGKLDSTKVIRPVSGAPFGLEVEEEYVDTALALLAKIGHQRAYRREQMPAKYHYGTHPTRLTNLILIPETGWTLDYAPNDRPVKNKGAHGFDSFDRDMHMVFYGTGPAFKPNYRQRLFQNQNMYLILCHLTGCTPAPNDGEWKTVRGMFRK